MKRRFGSFRHTLGNLPALLICCGMLLASEAPAHQLVIEGGTLLNGLGATPLEDVVILIEGNRIKAVAQKGKIQYPPGAALIQAHGKTIIPGLIDMHVHYDSWMPELLLAHGVTSAVELSAVDWTFAQMDGIAKGRIPGPRLFAANLAFNGPLLPLPASARRPALDARAAESAARKFILANIARGIRLAKVYTGVTAEEVRGIADEAGKAGINVMGHLASLDARQAAELGIKGLAHSSGVALATILDKEKVDALRAIETYGIAVDYPHYLMYHAFMDRAAAEDLIRLLVAKEVRIEPDLINVARWAAKRRGEYPAEDERLLRDPNLQYIPQNIRDRVRYWAPLEVMAPEEKRLLQNGYANLQEFLRKFVRAGGKLLAGSDPAFVIPGLSLHRELELMVDAGLTPMEALQAATKNNAEFLGMADQMGSVTEGKLADLVILGKDPLRDIANTRTVEVVIKDGKVIDTAYHADFTNPIPKPVRMPFVHPIPSLSFIAPPIAVEGRSALTLTLEGENFIRTSRVLFDGSEVVAAPDPASQLPGTDYLPHFTRMRAEIPPHLLLKVGSFPVTVVNPPPEGGTSGAAYLIVQFE